MPAETRLKRLVALAGRGGLLVEKALYQRSRALLGKVPDRLHLFVAGMQRSGTNMIMDVLERHIDTEVYHERDARAFDNYQMRDRPVIHGLADRSVAPLFVIKALCESHELASLMDDFMPAKALWVLRNYRDVVNSMLVSFGNQARQVKWVVANRGENGWWLGRGISEETRAVLQRLVRPDIDDANACALQWYFRNKTYFEQHLERDPRVLLVNYDALVAEPDRSLNAVFDFAGLAYSRRVARGIFATSVGRRAPPVIDPEIESVCDGLDQEFRRLLAGNVCYAGA